MKEYWECTYAALTWPDGKGPNILVDDGGDATMMILEGSKWEVKYEESQVLPDPSKYNSEDERMLYEVLRDTIPTNPTKFRDMLKDFYGCSEETTTGVHRLI